MTARFSPDLAAVRGGAFLGILVAFALVVLLPMGLNSVFGMHVAKAWGLAKMAAPLCVLGAVPGALAAWVANRKPSPP